MTERDQARALANDLDALIARYADEFDLPLAAAIGVLAIKQHELIAGALEDAEEEDET